MKNWKPKLFSSLLLLLGLGVAQGSLAQPRWSFFCEVSGEQLLRMSQDSILLGQLQQLDATLRVGLTDLSADRGQALRRFEAAGVPLIAWLLLSPEEGYWVNLGNEKAVYERYQDFRAWSQREGLRWEAIGLDLEPALQEVEQWYASPWSVAWRGYRRLFHPERLAEAQRHYQVLIEEMQTDGYLVESYLFPPILDERQAGTQSFQLLTGIPELAVDREIPMCYSSAPVLSPAAILSYGSEPGISYLALGSTGGGLPFANGQELPTLDWEALERDLLLAQQVADEVVIFSLEGCLRQEFMERLVAFDWQQMTSLYSGEITQVKKQRRNLGWALQALDRPILTSVVVGLLLLSLLILLVLLLRGLFRRRKGREEG